MNKMSRNDAHRSYSHIEERIRGLNAALLVLNQQRPGLSSELVSVAEKERNLLQAPPAIGKMGNTRDIRVSVAESVLNSSNVPQEVDKPTPQTPVGERRKIIAETPTLQHARDKFVSKYGEMALKNKPERKPGEDVLDHKRRVLFFYENYAVILEYQNARAQYIKSFGVESINKESPPRVKDEDDVAYRSRLTEFYNKRVSSSQSEIPSKLVKRVRLAAVSVGKD